jgi:hypothetical protein
LTVESRRQMWAMFFPLFSFIKTGHQFLLRPEYSFTQIKMIVKKILRKPIDAVLSAVAKKYANKQLSGIGKVVMLSLDSIDKKVSVSLDLKGEKETIRLDVLKYDILKEGGRFYFVVMELSSSREWIEVAVKKYLGEKRVEIPRILGMWT